MPDFLYDKRISHSMKIDLEKGLAHYAVQKGLIFDSRPWRQITLQDLLPSLQLQHDRWKPIDPKTLNSGTQTGTRILTKYLSKLRYDKSKMPDLIDEE